MSGGLDSVLSAHAGSGAHHLEKSRLMPRAVVFERMRAMGAAATSAADLQRAMGAFGLECDPYSNAGRKSGAPRLPPGYRAANGRTDR